MNRSQRASELAAQLSAEDIDMGMVILRGIRDELKKERILFEYNKDADYAFGIALWLIPAAYNGFGMLKSFDLAYEDLDR